MNVNSVGFGALFAVSLLLTACDSSKSPATLVVPVESPGLVVEVPKFPLGDNKFETWNVIGTPTVHNAVVSAPDATKTADAIEMKLNDGLGTLDTRPVKAGETRKARIHLWGTPGQNVALQLVNWCSATPLEVETRNIVLTAEPTEYGISKTFTNNHDCSRFQFILIDDTTATINAWNARLE